MKLHILFIQRKENYPEQYTPEARIVWDEYTLEENPEGFKDECEQELLKLGPVQAHKVLAIEVNQDDVRRLLLDTPALEGKIVP